MMANITLIIGIILILIGLWGSLTNKDIIRIIIGFNIVNTGIHLIIISIGFITNGTAPIINNISDISKIYVDPVPQALVLTSIVIGLGVTAFMLVYAINMQKKKGSLNIDNFKDLKW